MRFGWGGCVRLGIVVDGDGRVMRDGESEGCGVKCSWTRPKGVRCDVDGVRAQDSGLDII